MMDRPQENQDSAPQTPPGKEWVIMRSGKARSEIFVGEVPPPSWLDGTSGIAVRGKEDKKWYSFDSASGQFTPAPEPFASTVEGIWNDETGFFRTIRRKFRSLFPN
jgi:hypothetical protein